MRAAHRIIKQYIMVICFALLGLSVQASGFVEGVHYQKLNKPQLDTNTNKVGVMEFFWYGCSHCYSLEPSLNAWLVNKPEFVEFDRVPAVFRSSWQTHAKAYYTAELLELGAETHHEIFNQIHVNNNSLLLDTDLEAFFGKYGVDKKTFEQTFNSFGVHTKLKSAEKLQRDYRIHSVPTLVINNKYITDAAMAGGNQRLIAVMDYLVKKERDTMNTITPTTIPENSDVVDENNH